MESLLHATYPGISNPQSPRYFTERTILATSNETVDELNHTILAKFSGVIHTFAGYDKVVHETQEQQGHYAEDLDAGYAPEYLQTLTPNGFPKAILALKVGCPVMLLRNLDPSQGLCNGTRLLITCTSTHVLEGRILGGDHDGNPVFIPCITLYSHKSDLTFVLACCQFPVCLAFAMTINKSQGQSVKHVGIDLHTPVFTHGQLYVALSRVTAKNQFYVLFPQGEAGTQAQNVVYPEHQQKIIKLWELWSSPEFPKFNYFLLMKFYCNDIEYYCNTIEIYVLGQNITLDRDLCNTILLLSLFIKNLLLRTPAKLKRRLGQGR